MISEIFDIDEVNKKNVDEKGSKRNKQKRK